MIIDTTTLCWKANFDSGNDTLLLLYWYYIYRSQYKKFSKESDIFKDKKVEYKQQEEITGEKSNIKIEGYKGIGISYSTRTGTELDQSLNLSINGSPNPGWNIEGTITDHQIPDKSVISTTLDELDEIYLKLYYPNGYLNTGEINLYHKISNLMEINKRIQGIHSLYNTRKDSISFWAGRLNGENTIIEIYLTEQNRGPFYIADYRSSAFSCSPRNHEGCAQFFHGLGILPLFILMVILAALPRRKSGR